MYRINEVFSSVQGEGAFSGTPSLFIRFAGCNSGKESLECSTWCDTEYQTSSTVSVDELKSYISDCHLSRVVFTGGEPLLQLTPDLVVDLKATFPDTSFAVETNGTLSREGYPADVWWTVSPKPPLYRTSDGPIDELKIVVGDDFVQLTSMLDQFVDRLPGGLLYLQPRDSDIRLGKVIAEYLVERLPAWRLCLQLHKLIEVR